MRWNYSVFLGADDDKACPTIESWFLSIAKLWRKNMVSQDVFHGRKTGAFMVLQGPMRALVLS